MENSLASLRPQGAKQLYFGAFFVTGSLKPSLFNAWAPERPGELGTVRAVRLPFTGDRGSLTLFQR